MALASRLTVVLLALLAVVASTAHAGTVPIQSPVAAGPLVSGSDAVWVEKTIADESLHVRRAAPDGPATTIQSFPGSGSDGCHFVEGFAGSATTVALLRRVARYDPARSGCVDSSSELLVSRGGGGFARVEGGAGCTPRSVDVDGDVLAIVHDGCEGGQIVVRDLASGGGVQPVPWSDGTASPGDIEIAGRYLAWIASDYQGGTARFLLVVFDRLAGGEAYRVDLRPLLGDTYPIQLDAQLRLQDDGTVVVALPRHQPPHFRPRIVWTSVAQPYAHDVPVTPANSRLFALSGGLLALQRGDPPDFAVIDLAGNVANVFDFHDASRLPGADFDGRRLVWEHDGIRNEAYPYTPPPRAAPVPVGGGSASQQRVSAPGGDGESAELTAAGDPVGRRALLAWVEIVRRPNGSPAASEVFVRALDASGRPRRRPVQVSSMGADQVSGAHAPAIAYDSRRRRYIVVWYGDGPGLARGPCPQPGPVVPGSPPCRMAESEVYARVFDASGRPLGPQRRVTVTGPPASTDVQVHSPSVVYDARADTYLLAYVAGTVGGGASHGVRTQMLAADGRRRGGSRLLVPRRTSFVSTIGRLVADPTGRRLFVYAEPRPNNGREVLALRVDRRGRRSGAPVPISDPGGAAEAVGPIAFHPGSGRFLVVLGDVSQGVVTARISARLIGVDGRPAGPIVRLAGVESRELSLAPAGRRGWLLAFAKRTQLDVEIYARTLTARGAVTGDEVRLSQMGEDPQVVEFGSEPQEGHEPALTALARGRLLSAWVGRGKDDGKPETYARPLRAG